MYNSRLFAIKKRKQCSQNIRLWLISLPAISRVCLPLTNWNSPFAAAAGEQTNIKFIKILFSLQRNFKFSSKIERKGKIIKKIAKLCNHVWISEILKIQSIHSHNDFLPLHSIIWFNSIQKHSFIQIHFNFIHLSSLGHLIIPFITFHFWLFIAFLCCFGWYCLFVVHTYVRSFVCTIVCLLHKHATQFVSAFPVPLPPPFQPLTNCITESHHPHIWRELRLAGEDVVFVFLHPWMTYPYWRSFAHLDIGAGVFSLRYSITFGKEKKMKHFVVNYRKTLSPISISSRFYLVIPPSPSTSTCTPLSPSLHANIFIIKAIQPLLICLLLFSTLIVYYL